MYSFIFVLLIPLTLCVPNFNVPALYQLTDPEEHLECPTWDEQKQMLFYVDIHSGRIFSFDYNTGEIRNITLNGEVSPVVPSRTDPDKLIVALNRSVLVVGWDGKGEVSSQKVLVTLQEDKPTSRLNDGKADSKGRIWFGTMGAEVNGNLDPNQGALYRISKDSLDKPAVMIAPVNISNGLAWNKANDKFYYIDTPSLQIAEYDFDAEKGTISNKRVAFDLNTIGPDANPDGMTIDKDDNLWIALYGGGSVISVDPRASKLLKRIAIPAEAVTSVMWGGPYLDILFVTTSRVSLSEEQRKKQPAAGSLFAITNLGTSGLPMNRADLIN